MPRMFLNGTAMSGGAAHHLVGGAAPLAATTAPRYRFWSVDGTTGYPALEDVGPDGTAVEGELYELTYDQLREVLLPGEPEALELGVVELADGSGALGMLLRRGTPPAALTDISVLASWRRYTS